MRTNILPLQRAEAMPKPYDPREQDVYHATPESIAHAKAEAAKERAEVEAYMKDYERRAVKADRTLHLVVEEFGMAWVMARMQFIAAERGYRLR